MIYTERTREAMKLCLKAHEGQEDKGGFPYCFHPIHLADQMKDESTCILALLHDVVEDTDYTLEDVTKIIGLTKEEAHALDLLTHDPAISYEDYVHALADNPLARKVKMADLTHNLDLSRLPHKKPFKYDLMIAALEYLNGFEEK